MNIVNYMTRWDVIDEFEKLNWNIKKCEDIINSIDDAQLLYKVKDSLYYYQKEMSEEEYKFLVQVIEKRTSSLYNKSIDDFHTEGVWSPRYGVCVYADDENKEYVHIDIDPGSYDNELNVYETITQYQSTDDYSFTISGIFDYLDTWFYEHDYNVSYNEFEKFYKESIIEHIVDEINKEYEDNDYIYFDEEYLNIIINNNKDLQEFLFNDLQDMYQEYMDSFEQ